jgi:hypothetical protein
MKYMGVEYTIHRGPRGWAWKIYREDDANKDPAKLGFAESRNEAIKLAKATIDELLGPESRNFERQNSAA